MTTFETTVWAVELIDPMPHTYADNSILIRFVVHAPNEREPVAPTLSIPRSVGAPFQHLARETRKVRRPTASDLAAARRYPARTPAITPRRSHHGDGIMMSCRARRAAVPDALARSGCATSGAMAAPRGSDEPRLDQLFAEPMVQQLMYRDGIDEVTTRRLLHQVASARAAREARCIPSTTPAMDDANTIVRLLHETARLWCKRYDKEARARIPGMTRARAAAIVHLAREDGPSQAQLAERLMVAPMTLVRLLDGLERLGWVERDRTPGDRRARSLRLTPTAHQLLPSIREVDRIVLSDVGAGIDADGRVKLITTLTKMKENSAGHAAERVPDKR